MNAVASQRAGRRRHSGASNGKSVPYTAKEAVAVKTRAHGPAGRNGDSRK